MPQQLDTHLVDNQPPPLINYNLYALDVVLQEAVVREGGGWAHRKISDFGA